MNHTRLLHAEGQFQRRDLLSRQYSDSWLDVTFAANAGDGTSSTWVSVIIGKNGTGKSRLLAGVVDLLEALDRGTGRRRADEVGVSEISFACNGKVCRVATDGKSGLKATVDGVSCAPAYVPLPAKIIALTTTPFDKFRVPRPPHVKDDPQTPSRYLYLGLRDRSGRASTTAPIFRALEGLFEASRAEEARRAKIAGIFRFLNYTPQVEAQYEVSQFNRQRLEALAAGVTPEIIKTTPYPSSFPRPLDIMLDREPELISELRVVAQEALGRLGASRVFRVRADFLGYSGDEDFFRRLQLLRRAGLLRMKATEVQRDDGTVLDLKLASSGELGIVTSFLGLASVIEDGSLVFIDEPEISLHPEWQNRYVDLLLQTFDVFTGCHFVLATHSPLILSDISPKNSSVITLGTGNDESEAGTDFAGQSADYLLVNAFEAPGNNNLFLKNEVVKALRLAADGKAATQEYSDVVQPLLRALPNLDRESPVAALIDQLGVAGERARQTQ